MSSTLLTKIGIYSAHRALSNLRSARGFYIEDIECDEAGQRNLLPLTYLDD
jgi:hypothetical protein|tara:strand:- start:1615 stop:1767 length:153 start_codon:yes stop_codon:yes gene_type:complete